MKINLAQLLFILFFGLLSSFVVSTQAFAAPSLNLSPATVTVNKNDTTQVNLTINTESNNAFGADAILSIPSGDISVTSVSNGGFFTDFSYAVDTSNNRLEIHGYFSNLYQTKSGTGSLATITLQAKKDSGTNTVSFLCNGTSTSTQILDANGHNMLDCANLNQLAFAFSGAPAGSTPTPTPTATPTPTPQPTATPGPVTPGYVDPTCDGLAASPTTGKKPLSVTFVCTGESLRNDVTAAEFNFGNGQIKLVEKNVGSFGSISTTHTFDAIGSYGVTCRLRDNNQRFSSIPPVCGKTITVVATQTIPIPRATPTVSIQPQVVELVPYATPTATIAVTPRPTEEPIQEQENPWGKYFLGGGIALVALLLGLWLIAGSKKPKPPKQPPVSPTESQEPTTPNNLPVEETPVIQSPPFSDFQPPEQK